jgi:hypothetical protein
MTKARLGWAVAAAVALQAFVLYFLLHQGALSALIPWDDCAVLLQGLENVQKLQGAHSFWELIGAARYLDLHSPLSGLQTMAGLLVSGGELWAPYALSFVPICFVLWILSKTDGLKDNFLFAAAVILVLTQPITLMALAEIKADWKGGLFMAAAIFVLFDAEERDSNTGRLVGAFLLGLTLLAKLTGFYNTVPMVGTFAAFEVYGAVKRRHDAAAAGLAPKAWVADLKPRFGLWAICAALILVPYVAFFVYGHALLLPYIREALSSSYDLGLPLPERIRYYSPYSNPSDGASVWGNLHWLSLVVLLAAVAMAAVKRAWMHLLALAGILGVAAVFLAPLLAAHTLNPSFASAFFGIVIGLSLVALRIFGSHAPKPAVMATPFVVALLMLPSSLPLTPPRDSSLKPYGRELLLHFQDNMEAINKAVVASETNLQPLVVFTYEHVGMPFPDLSIMHFQSTGRFLRLERIDDLAGADTAPLLSRADFVLTFVPNMPAPVADIDKYPISADLAAADVRVRATGRYNQIGAYTVRSGEVRLYQARSQPRPTPGA